jgi:MtN3 and saliva related transmembrane protein
VTTVIGIVAAACGVVGFLPQAWKIIKTRETKDLSTPMWTLQCAAFALWIAYGVGLGELPIIIPNSITLLLSIFILTMKLLPAQKRDEVADQIERVAPSS